MFRKKRNPKDKIFDNKYNRGEIDTHCLQDVQADAVYEKSYMDHSKKAIDFYFDEALYELIFDIWQKSEWADDPDDQSKKRVNKHLLSQIYNHFKINLKDTLYSNTEIFCAIGEFLNQNYFVLYEMISTKYKIEILKEIEEKHPRFFKDNLSSLF